jgi:hypothetical protein
MLVKQSIGNCLDLPGQLQGSRHFSPGAGSFLVISGYQPVEKADTPARPPGLVDR